MFKPQALEFIARKVANCSGDVRRCLELCRRCALPAPWGASAQLHAFLCKPPT